MPRFEGCRQVLLEAGSSCPAAGSCWKRSAPIWTPKLFFCNDDLARTESSALRLVAESTGLVGFNVYK
jgi:hypothetical protein